MAKGFLFSMPIPNLQSHLCWSLNCISSVVNETSHPDYYDTNDNDYIGEFPARQKACQAGI
jgi:hypothetical protein